MTTDFSDERVQENPLAEKPVSGDRTDPPKKKKKKRKKKGFSFDKISSIITFIKDPANKRGIRTVKKELFALLRYMAPEKIDGKVVFWDRRSLYDRLGLRNCEHGTSGLYGGTPDLP